MAHLRPDPPIPLALAAALAVVLVPAAISLRGGLYDDAWIHLRIAEHLVATGAPEFNPGAPVLASSSTPWTLIVAALSIAGLGAAGPLAAFGAGLTAAAAGVWAQVAADALRDVPRPTAHAAVIAVGVTTAAFLFGPGAGGMEAPLALLCLGIGWLLWGRDRDEAAVFLGLAAAVRLELVVFVGIAAAEAILQRRPRRIVGAIVGIGPFLAAELLWFHTIIPHPVIAKRTVYEVRFMDAVLLIARNLPWPTGPGLWGLLQGAGWAVVAAAAAAIRPGLMPLRLIAGAAAVVAGYLVLRQYVHPWYLPNFEVPGAVGVWIAFARSQRPILIGAAVVSSIPATATLLVRLAHAALDPSRDSLVQHTRHVRDGMAVGTWAAERLPDGLIVTSEIGALGYGFGGRVEDGMALVSPAALHHHPMSVPDQRATGLIGAIPAGFVAELRPDLVVGRDLFMDDFAGSAAAADYVQMTGDEVPGTQSLVVYARRDVVSALRR